MYTIVERDGKYCLYEQNAQGYVVGETLGCHNTREAAEDQMAAIAISRNKKASALQECLSKKIPHLIRSGYERDQAIAIAYSECGEKSWESLPEHERKLWLIWARRFQISDSKSTTIKQIAPDRIGGYGVVWGDPEHRDLQGDYFTPDTNFFLPPVEFRPGEAKSVYLPCLYDHAMSPLPNVVVRNGDARDYVLGIVDTVRKDEIGLWIEAQIQRHEEWVKKVLELVKQGILHWSSGSSSYLVKRADDGRILNWPLVEFSATPVPAEPRGTNVVVLKHYREISKEPSDQDARMKLWEVLTECNCSNSKQQERKTMTKISHNAAMAMIRAYAEAERENILAAIKQVGDEPSTSVIEEALQPLAEELASIAGVSVEEALAELVNFVAETLARKKPVEEESAPEQKPMEMGEQMPEGAIVQPTMSVEKIAQEAVNKALRKILPAHAAGEPITRKNIAVHLESNKPLTLGSWIKAIVDRRWDVLEREHNRIKAEHKALGIDPDTSGGYLVPVGQAGQIIELLRQETVVLPLCRQIPLNTATLPIPVQTGGATVTWLGENEVIPASQASFGQKVLVAKKMAVRVILSNELLEDADPSIDAIIREDIARAAAEEIDRVILEGSGIGGEPLGLLYSGATVTPLNAAPSYSALSQAVQRVEQEKVARIPTWAWAIAGRDKHSLRMLEDTAGNLIFAGAGPYQQSAGGPVARTLLDYPWYDTNVIVPDGSNETRMYFGQWQDVVVGMRKSLEIKASGEAGTAFESDQTWVRAILRMDLVLRHPESIEILSDVQSA